ncbi:MAG: helix-turn-helix transcriptional regulator [Clostridia bacterium]|nr:helix-turn-helix transcriptional regulator [Clostridia bacterium]
MYQSHINNYEVISNANFYTEAISAAHRVIKTPNKYLRYANEHLHDRIVCIVSGNCRFDMFNEKPINASAGSIVYIPYNIAYSSEWADNEKSEVYSINYIMKDLNGYRITICPEIRNFSHCDKHIIEGLFKECYHIFSTEKFGFPLKCKYTFLNILYSIISSENLQKQSKVSKAIKYIDSNYLEDFSVTDLANLCNLGECMFRRYFKAETGISPLKYRNKLRIEKAYELLVSESCSVTEAMELTGFYDASYFNKCFKSQTGKTPSECKNKLS